MSDFHGGAGEISLAGRAATSQGAVSGASIDLGERRGEFHRFADGAPTQAFSGAVGGSAEMLSSLAVAINRNSIGEDDAKVGALTEWENPGIPAGYTYLLQLVGHDLVQTSTASPSFGASGAGSRNLRRTGLDLETVFGGGPATCPIAYREPEGDGARVKLKTGGFAVRNEDGKRIFGEDEGDLARIPVKNPETGEVKGARDVLLADPRNEDNAILAQLTALFHRLHNRLVDAIRRREDILSDAPSEGRGREAYIGDLARGVLAYCYRNMIRKDLLPRLLDEEVLAHYEKAFSEDGTDALLDEPPEGGSLPVEFAFAASRIGHFMVRPRYNFRTSVDPSGRDETFSLGDVIRASSRRRWRGAPFKESWRIDWRRFFPVDETIFCRSRGG